MDQYQIKFRLFPAVMVWASVFVLIFSSVQLRSANAQSIDNIPQSPPGTLVIGPVDPDAGRMATIEYLGGYIIAIPESPGSEADDHRVVKAWDFSNLTNPVSVPPINPSENGGDFGKTRGPFLSHGSIRRDNEVFIGGFPFDAVRLNADGSLEHARWSGQSPPWLVDRDNQRLDKKAPWYSKGGMMRPWALRDSWAYGENAPDVTQLSLRERLLAEWNVAEDSGVTGFGNFIGNLLVYSSDQRNTGVAVYDASDVYFDAPTNTWKPRLLDSLNIPLDEGGIGGYWSEISGHYIVFARRSRTSVNPNFFAGIQVVDFSDPRNLRLQCSVRLHEPNSNRHWTLSSSPMYLGFKDEYAFTDKYKVNLETCEVELILDITQGQTGDLCYNNPPCPARAIDTSQYSRLIGNLWFTGGYPTVADTDGMSVWVNESAPDTRAPYIAYHIPRPNQTNYPVDVPLGFSIPETLRSQTVVVTATADPGETETLTLTEVGGDKVNIDYVISHTGMLTVEPLEELKPDTTYEVVFTSGILDAAGNAMQPYSFRFSTGSVVTPVEGPQITQVSVSPSRTVSVGQNVTVSIQAPSATSYQLALDSETPVWRSSATRVFNFNSAGEYIVNLRARNASGTSGLLRERITVEAVAASTPAGAHSSQAFCSADTGSVLVVNPDNDSLTKLSADSLTKDWEVTGPNKPMGISESSDGEIWVTAFNDDRLYVFDQNGTQLHTIQFPYGSGPSHIVHAPDGHTAYVSLYSSGQVARVNTRRNLGDSIQYLSVGPTPRAMSVSPDGKQLLVTRFISSDHWGEVYQIDLTTWQFTNTFRLDKHLVDDQLDEGRGLPNYLAGIVINAAGTLAYVSAKKDNVDRGLANGLGLDLDDDNTVRTMLMVLDLEAGQELRNSRLDFDNADSPSGVAISDNGQYLFVALQGKNSVAVLGLNEQGQFTGSQSLIQSGLATQSLCFDGTRNTLFAKNYTERTITAFDLSGGVISPAKVVQSTVANEVFTSQQLSGLQVFYNAFNGLQVSPPVGKMSAEGYISCATCHIDGGHDGRTWDFTGRGEGIRNNISLRGRGGNRFGNVHWSANFDEIQDFEHDIRNAFGGTGLMTDAQFAHANTPLGSRKAGLSAELDALAAYVSRLGKESLPRSPYRASGGGLSQAAQAGKAAFVSEGCQSCHSGSAYTDGKVHDVGTLRVHSGQRLGDRLPGIKTPSLLGVFDSAPYLHDGSAAQLSNVFNTVGGAVLQAEDAERSFADLYTQVGYSYLRGAGGVRIDDGGRLSFDDVDGGAGGKGRIRLRFGANERLNPAVPGRWLVSINGGAEQSITAQDLPKVAGQNVNFVETRSLTIDLEPGQNNRISIRYSGGIAVLDEVTISRPEDVQKAQPHLRVASMSESAMGQLISYVASLDQTSAPADNATNIFENPDDDELCIPIKIKNGNVVLVCL